MHWKQHAASCEEKFGEQYEKVHEKLDQYCIEFRGFSHRLLLHHSLGIEKIMEDEEIIKQYGRKARAAAELHIREDTEGDLPDDWTYYEVWAFHPNDLDRLCEKLKEIYGNEVYERVEAKTKMT